VRPVAILVVARDEPAEPRVVLAEAEVDEICERIVVAPGEADLVVDQAS
jgi:hypothetical protein